MYHFNPRDNKYGEGDHTKKKKYGEGVNVCGDGGKFCSEWCDVTIGGVNVYEDFKSKKVGDSGALIFSLYILIKKKASMFWNCGNLNF